MTISITDKFRAALNHLLKRRGHGSQTQLADAIGVDRGYLNAVVKGRKSGSDKLKGQIADYFDMHVEDMLTLGRQILSDEDVECQETSLQIPSAPQEALSGIQKAEQILKSGTQFSALFMGLTDSLHDKVRLKEERLTLIAKVEELELRLSKLEDTMSQGTQD